MNGWIDDVREISNNKNGLAGICAPVNNAYEKEKKKSEIDIYSSNKQHDNLRQPESPTATKLTRGTSRTCISILETSGS